MKVPGGYPTFFLELEDAESSKPVLRCYGIGLATIGGITDKVLLAEMRETVTIRWQGGHTATNVIGVTAGHGRSVENIDRSPFSVAVVIPKVTRPRALGDFEYISRGSIYLSLPAPCLKMLGYDS